MCSPSVLSKNCSIRLTLTVPAAVQTPAPMPPLEEGRKDLLVFVSILLKIIEQSHNFKLTLQVKAMISECVRRNRMGDEHFTPLQKSIAERVRGLVGPNYWKQAEVCARCFNREQQRKKRTQLASPRRSTPAIQARQD